MLSMFRRLGIPVNKQRTVLLVVAVWMITLAAAYQIGILVVGTDGGGDVSAQNGSGGMRPYVSGGDDPSSGAPSGGTAGDSAVPEKLPEADRSYGSRLTDAMNTQNQLERIANLTNVLATMEADDFLAAFDELEKELDSNIANRQNYDEIQLFFSAWGKTGGEEAMERLSAAGSDGRGGWPLRTVLSGWGEGDPEGALAWAVAKENGREEWQKQNDAYMRETWVNSAINGVAKNDVFLAAQMAEEMSDMGGERSLRKIVDELIRTDKNQFSAWMNSFDDPTGEFGRRALILGAEQLALYDPRLAAEVALQPEMGINRSAIRRVASGWAGQSPDEALAWAEAIDNESLRSSALASVKSTIRGRAQRAAKREEQREAARGVAIPR